MFNNVIQKGTVQKVQKTGVHKKMVLG